MARDPKRTGDTASVAADAVCALADGGYLKIFTGPKPANADTALSSQTLLARLKFGTPAFAAASDGIAIANALEKEDSALATGTAAWFRVYAADNTKLWDGTVGTSGCDLNLDSTSIAVRDEVEVTSFRYIENLSLDD